MDHHWSKRHILGSGTYATVYLASKLNSRLSYSVAAVKSDNYYGTSLKKEGEILYKLRGCPEIIQCFGEDISIEKNRQVYNLLLEYAPGGSLADLIQKNGGKIPESNVACYTYMLLKGLSHIHEKGIVHCDMKPDNILVFPSVHGSTIQNLKIADFGMAKTTEEEEEFIPGASTFNRGALQYASPESISKGIHKPVTDIWSLGCIIAEMITGETIWTYKDAEDLINQINSRHPCIPQNISHCADDFLKLCLEKNEYQRWTAKMLLDHPFIFTNLSALPLNFKNPVLPNPFGSDKWVYTFDLFSPKRKIEQPTNQSVYV
ncbi:mitogen-activated kinase kinase kinase NPK1-like [Olea europaea subsp. europaea]|uniref:Mitogen-activated kinase kinase kinase NPK1-like n=1 Tax=Olea europaea subsp. europaea TaxID=158383 RepID=A0A8S0URE6_OLEEU|nr:mitogen-activated kinase kinase kinase NPK1-like [Olea europaea subsp. europaea]